MVSLSTALSVLPARKSARVTKGRGNAKADPIGSADASSQAKALARERALAFSMAVLPIFPFPYLVPDVGAKSKRFVALPARGRIMQVRVAGNGSTASTAT